MHGACICKPENYDVCEVVLLFFLPFFFFLRQYLFLDLLTCVCLTVVVCVVVVDFRQY